MSAASINGETLSYCSVRLPSWGIWRATVRTMREVGLEVGDAATIQLRDLTLVGTVARGADWNGDAGLLVVGGANGWNKTVGPRGYRNGAGVKLSAVAKDLARDAGEELDPSLADRVLGSGYVLPKQAASASMHQLSPLAWWVGNDGKTRIGARPSSALAVPSGALLRRERMSPTIVLGMRDIANVVPGATIDGVAIASVVHELMGSDLRSKLLMGTTS